jgi:hypothetical protein
MRSTFDLPDDLMKRAKIAAVRRGSTSRDLVAEALRNLRRRLPGCSPSFVRKASRKAFAVTDRRPYLGES